MLSLFVLSLRWWEVSQGDFNLSLSHLSWYNLSTTYPQHKLWSSAFFFKAEMLVIVFLDLKKKRYRNCLTTIKFNSPNMDWRIWNSWQEPPRGCDFKSITLLFEKYLSQKPILSFAAEHSKFCCTNNEHSNITYYICLKVFTLVKHLVKHWFHFMSF